jgi:predicted RNase H-like nuclease (RuvC/YqgF family)
MSKDAKDLVIENLRNQIEEYKQKLTAFNFEALSSKIASLEKMVVAKEQELMDLRSATTTGGSDAELRTKNIVLQSKIRTLEGKVTELSQEKEQLEMKIARLEREAGNSADMDALRLQLRQEMEKTERLRNQLNALSRDSGQLQQLQQENQQLKNKIAQLQANPQGTASGGLRGGADPAEIQRLKQEIQARDQRIAQLESTGGSDGAAGGPMAALRLQREINALKAQLQATKRSEAELQQKLNEAMRKNQSWDLDGY